jgi:hypothetical protein
MLVFLGSQTRRYRETPAGCHRCGSLDYRRKFAWNTVWVPRPTEEALKENKNPVQCQQCGNEWFTNNDADKMMWWK